MAEDINTETNCTENVKQTEVTEGQSPFMFIDCGEQLVEELQTVKDELQKQVLSVANKVDLLWEVVQTVIVFVIPVVSCLGLSFFSQFYLPGWMSVALTTIFISITLGLTFLHLTPLNEAITAYTDFKVFTPKFLDCSCKTCSNKNNCSEGNKENTSAEEQDKHEHRAVNTVQLDNHEEFEFEELTENNSDHLPNSDMFVNDGIRRRQMERNPSLEQSVFRETTSFLESSINNQSNEETAEKELEID